MSELVLYERNDTVAVITLNRPERLNAMDQSMLEALNQAAQRAEQDDHIRAVVLTGSGNAFSSGFDLKAQAEHPPRGIDEWRPILRRNFDACMTFWHLAKPTVAAVHGPALAGACELAMAGDKATTVGISNPSIEEHGADDALRVPHLDLLTVAAEWKDNSR